jgi:hypothetical protein
MVKKNRKVKLPGPFLFVVVVLSVSAPLPILIRTIISNNHKIRGGSLGK